MSTPRKKKNTLRAEDPFLDRERQKYENPLPSREYLLDILNRQGVPVLPEQLMHMLSITREEEAFFLRRLRAMERDGEIIINRKGAVCVAEKLDLVRAVVIGHPEGFGFARPDDGSADIALDAWEMRKVLPKDKVMVRETGLDHRGRRTGKIAEVLDHGLTRIVGRFHAQQGVYFAVPTDKRIGHEFLLPPEAIGAAKEGDIVVVGISSYPTRYTQPIGRVDEVLGEAGDPGMEIEIALRNHDLPFEFSAGALEQAKATPQKVKKRDWKLPGKLERRDLRDTPLVTIDGETARDFDDAVYCEPKGRGWRLIVAIADVSHYVKPGDALDTTARERGNSVYFPRRVIPMLPEALSNGICSLNPDVERCAMVCEMLISRQGHIKKYEFYPAVIRSHARFTYTDVWALLSGELAAKDHARGALLPQLQHLYQVFQVFIKERKIRGAIDFDTQETTIDFDEKGRIAGIRPIVRNDAHRLIEECMLAANVCSADFLIAQKQPTLFRVHEGPTAEKLEALHQFLREAGLALSGGDAPETLDYAQLIERIKGRPDASLIQTVLLRSMQQAVYTPENAGHFGLAYAAYTHFTSPIRRYPDLLVHRAIKAALAGKKYKGEDWVELGIQCSMTERRADEASRDVLNWLKCEYMRDKVGQVFSGTVSAVTSFGLFVLLDGIYTEGLVHISELAADYFHFDKARHRLVGEKTGKAYRLGDTLQVKVVRVDMELARIDFALLPEAGAAKPAQKASAARTTEKPARKPRASSTEPPTPRPSAPSAAPRTRRKKPGA